MAENPNAPTTPDGLPLILCKTCTDPIAWPTQNGKPISPGSYRQRRYCGVQCAAEASQSQGPHGKVKARWAAAIRAIEARERAGPRRLQVVPPPWGHRCDVCGELVTKGHPIHYARSIPTVTVIREGTPAAAAFMPA